MDTEGKRNHLSQKVTGCVRGEEKNSTMQKRNNRQRGKKTESLCSCQTSAEGTAPGGVPPWKGGSNPKRGRRGILVGWERKQSGKVVDCRKVGKVGTQTQGVETVGKKGGRSGGKESSGIQGSENRVAGPKRERKLRGKDLKTKNYHGGYRQNHKRSRNVRITREKPGPSP